MLKERIQEDIKNAMRARDKKKLAVLRMILAEFKVLDTSGKEDIKEVDYVKKAESYYKKLKKSLASYKTDEQKQPILDEMVIAEQYLPKKASRDEHQAIIHECGDMPINDMRKVVMSKLGDACDMSITNELLMAIKKS